MARARRASGADPYRVWLSEIMLQQTTVKAVAPYYARFLARFPTVAQLAAAPLDDVLKLWAGLGYYARARNLHACARAVVERHDGRFPDTEEALRTLPGIGAYTAAAIAAIAFDRRASPVDGNIERVIARLFAVEEELPGAKPRIRALADRLTPQRRAGDFAQAMMDLGATICTPKRPACAICPVDRCLRGARARRSGELSAQGGEEDRRAAARRGVRGVARRRPHPAAHARRRRPARRHDRGADDRMDAAISMTPRHSADAPDMKAAWRRLPGVGHAHLHAFSARAGRLCGAGPGADPRAARHALGRAERAARDGLAKRDAQGDSAPYRLAVGSRGMTTYRFRKAPYAR